jgi:lysophospholipase L1-like esterase
VLWRIGSADYGLITPNQVLLLIGINNIWEGDKGDETAAGIIKVHENCRRIWPDAILTTFTIPPFGPAFDFRSDARQLANVQLKAKLPRLLEIDQLFCEGQTANYYQPDHIHFSEVGYRALTNGYLRQFYTR